MRNNSFRVSILACAVFLLVCVCNLAAQTEPAGYNPVEYHRIELGAAKSLTARFQSVNSTPVISSVAGNIASANILRLLSTPKAVYLRQYFALDESGVLHLLLVPKTGDNHDIILSRITDANGTTISEKQARAWIRNYIASPLFAQHGKAYSSSTHSDALKAVISKNNAASIRFYFANNDVGRITTVVSGITVQNIESTAYIIDKSCCPPDIEAGAGELAQP